MTRHTVEFSLSRADPLYHLWRACALHVAKAAGAVLVREWEPPTRPGLVYIAFDRPISQTAIMDAMATVCPWEIPFDEGA